MIFQILKWTPVRNSVRKCIIRSLGIHTVECNFLLIQEDQSIPVNHQIKASCCELCFWLALTHNPACGGAHSRSCRWTQTPCALPLKLACVISTRSNRRYLWKPSDPFSCKAVPVHAGSLVSLSSLPSKMFVFFLYVVFSWSRSGGLLPLVQKIFPAVSFPLSIKIQPGNNSATTLNNYRTKQFGCLINHLFVSLF